MKKGNMENAFRNYLETLYEMPPYAKATDEWVMRHRSAIDVSKPGIERALVEMLTGWLRYADAVNTTWANNIGNDYILGPCWASIGDGLRGLLSGDLGRMDGGTLDRIVCRALQKEGFDPDTS